MLNSAAALRPLRVGQALFFRYKNSHLHSPPQTVSPLLQLPNARTDSASAPKPMNKIWRGFDDSSTGFQRNIF
jgi:hypothetical protein